MNGGMTECGQCGCDPCYCKAIEKRKQRQRVKDGKVVIESLWQAMMMHLPSWKMKIIRWLWPDIINVANNLKEYYWSDQDDQS